MNSPWAAFMNASHRRMPILSSNRMPRRLVDLRSPAAGETARSTTQPAGATIPSTLDKLLDGLAYVG
jgi:hypothetical protein